MIGSLFDTGQISVREAASDLHVNLSCMRHSVAQALRDVAGAVSVIMDCKSFNSGTVSYAHGDLQAGRGVGRQIFCA